MTSEAAKQHIEQIRRERFWLDDASRTPGDNPLMAMLRRALNQLATGIFEHAHHYIFELTQNADDNHYPESADRFLKFVLLENDPTNTPGSRGCLCVLNDETGFEKKDVESLCDIGNSTKQGNREGYIGEKGIGFKSVFLISDRPHIISNGYSFHFRQINCDAGLGYIVPHWNQQTFGIAQESPTAILLPLRSASGVDVAKQLADIEPECVLFLRRLRRIELVADQTGLSRTVKCVGSDGFFDLDADGTRARYFVHQSAHSCIHMNEPLREGVVSTCVTIALPLTVPVATDGRVFAFLPTEARTGFPFLINADFLLPASRERIFDTPEWNKQLVKFAAATFIETFEKLRSSPQNQTTAYCFIPTKSDLLPGASLFEPFVHVVHATLKESECIITESGGNSLPSATYFAGPMSRLLLADAPPKLATFKLVHPDLEKYRKRLEPLGIQILTIGQVLDICNDTEWLCNRKIEWWETLFELLSQNNITAASVAEFPIFLCRDGECRRPTDGVFHHADGQTLPTAIAAGWPTAHLFDTECQNRLQKKPAVWTWLTGIAGLRPFSTQSYITNKLLPWMCGQTGSQLVDAAKFIATNLKHSGAPNDPSWRQPLRPIRSNIALRLIANKIPWVLFDGRVILPENRGDKQLITPECLEGENGWNLLFPALDLQQA